MVDDLRYALRQLVKSPGFTTTVIVTLALSIGAITAIFSVVDTLLLRPLVCPQPDRLVTVRSVQLANPAADTGASVTDYLDWKDQVHSFTHIGFYFPGSFSLTGEGEPRRLRTIRITANYFEVLGIQPALGRTFLREEEMPGRGQVVMLSHALWQGTFAGAPTVIGRTIQIDNLTYTIVGVMPENFDRVGSATGWNDIAVPLVLPVNLPKRYNGLRFGTVQGRLKPGVSLGQAQAEMDLLSSRLAQKYPDTNKGLGALVIPTGTLQFLKLRPMLWSLLAAVGAVLLIACANIANLQLARAATRQREIALRLTLGAGRARLVRMLLTESLLLSCLGGGTGVLLAVWGLNAIHRLAQFKPLAALMYVRPDPGILGFALALSGVTGLVFGLAPAWFTSRVALGDALKQSARGMSEDASRGRVRSTLVILQIACSLMLLVSAGLHLRSFGKLAQIDAGFDCDRVAVLYLNGMGPRTQIPNFAQRRDAIVSFTDAVLARFSALPEVEAAGVSVSHLITLNKTIRLFRPFEIEGRPPVAPMDRPTLQWANASPDYFKAMGVRLLRGRTFTSHDDGRAPRVIVINEALAKTHFANEDPLGRRIRIDGGEWTQIVGLVADVVTALDEPVPAQAYEAFSQNPGNSAFFLVRTSGDPAALVPSMKAQIYAVDPNQAVSMVSTLRYQQDETLATRRFTMQLLGLFSSIALIIAAVGLYGVIAYSVNRRTLEIGIRMAIGAQVKDVLRLVLGQGARLVGAGLVLGIAGSFAIGRALQSQLFQTSPYDPPTLVATALFLTAVTALACWLPARRATKVNPIDALRAE